MNAKIKTCLILFVDIHIILFNIDSCQLVFLVFKSSRKHADQSSMPGPADLMM